MAEKQGPTVATASKKPRQRSPNYPAIGLEKALERLQPIKEQAGRHAMPLSVAYANWHYKSAAGDQTTAALKAFGLIEVLGSKDKRELRLTDAAWRILGHAPDRDVLLHAAALKPEIHRKLWEKYDGPPPADPIVKNYLIWELEFNPAFVDAFISQYRATLSFADVSTSDNVGEFNEIEVEESPQVQVARTSPTASIAPGASVSPGSPAAQRSQPSRHMTELAFRLTKDVDAKVTIYGEASQEAIKKLQALLALSEDAFPTAAELHPSKPADRDEPEA